MKKKIVGINFQKVGKIYHFETGEIQEIKVGDYVVVETSRGKQIGRVALILKDGEKAKDENLKTIIRKATPRDLLIRQLWQQKEDEVIQTCRKKAKERNLQGVKFVSAEFTFDGKRLTIFYNTEGEERVSLKKFQTTIARLYPKQRVELKQIGPRDVARIIGGLGACGIPERCCSRFLTEFNPISIKMAKIQGISLAPSEITGMCGRLRCCLMFEYEQYAEVMAKMPKKGKRVTTPAGNGKVVGFNVLARTVFVEIENSGQKEFPLNELTIN